MRTHIFASLFLVLILSGSTVPTLDHITASNLATASQPHALIGNWSLSTTGPSAGEPARAGIFSFHEDGAILVVFQARLNGTGTAEPIWWGEGHWEADGDATARYTMSWPVRDDLGALTGTVTFDGVLTIQDDGITFEDDRQLSQVSVRDQSGLLIASYGAEAGEITAAVTGHRIQVG